MKCYFILSDHKVSLGLAVGIGTRLFDNNLFDQLVDLGMHLVARLGFEVEILHLYFVVELGVHPYLR